jgi:hypothetical protein
MPATIDLAAYAGDNFGCAIAVTYTDTGQPVDLTGCSVKACLRYGAASDGFLVMFTFPTVIQLPNEILIAIFGADRMKLTSGCWDLEMTDKVGKVTTLVQGKVTVFDQVTV